MTGSTSVRRKLPSYRVFQSFGLMSSFQKTWVSQRRALTTAGGRARAWPRRSSGLTGAFGGPPTHAPTLTDSLSNGELDITRNPVSPQLLSSSPSSPRRCLDSRPGHGLRRGTLIRLDPNCFQKTDGRPTPSDLGRGGPL